jgi:L-ribulokinase
MTSFTIGFDFGTLQVRACLLQPSTGQILSIATVSYPKDCLDVNEQTHRVLMKRPSDWIQCAKQALQDVLRQALPYLNASSNNICIIGIGVAFTSCTTLPITSTGSPLCEEIEFNNPQQTPNAFPKLWKSHSPGAIKANEDLMKVIRLFHPNWLEEKYGSNLSVEWFHAKQIEIFDEEPKTFRAAYAFVEAGDWIAWKLTSHDVASSSLVPVNIKRSTCQAGYKACCENNQCLITAKMLHTMRPSLTEKDIQKLLFIHQEFVIPGIDSVGQFDIDSWITSPDLEILKQKLLVQQQHPPQVSASIIDAHAAALGLGGFKPNVLVMVVGTSGCYMINTKSISSSIKIKGVAGIVKDGISPGLVGIETGQNAVGDVFAWLEQFSGKTVTELEILATKRFYNNNTLPAHIWCIDLLNGARTPLMDPTPRGAIMNVSLTTTPDEVYLALAEALCFGILEIIHVLQRGGVQIDEYVIAGGGLVKPDGLFIVLLSKILQQSLQVVVGMETAASTAIGAAITGGFFSNHNNNSNTNSNFKVKLNVSKVSYDHLSDLNNEAKDLLLNRWGSKERFARYRQFTGLGGGAATKM